MSEQEKRPSGKMSFRQLKKDKEIPVEELGKTEGEIRIIEQKRREEQRKKEEENPASVKKQKWDNFWYHHKWKAIGGVIGAVLVVLFLRDFLFASQPDMVVVFATSTPMPTEVGDQISEVFSPLLGEGKEVLVDIVTIGDREKMLEEQEQSALENPLDDDEFVGEYQDSQLIMAGTMKLTAVMASDANHLFLFDTAGRNFFSEESGVTDLFVPLHWRGETVDGIPLKETIFGEGPFGPLFEDVTLHVRKPNKPEKENKEYEAAFALVEAFAKQQEK